MDTAYVLVLLVAWRGAGLSFVETHLSLQTLNVLIIHTGTGTHWYKQLTEAGFGCDIGAEKFFNIKCRYSGLVPDCVVLVATVRALKSHAPGAPSVKPGQPLDRAYTEENVALLQAGVCNMQHHVRNVAKFGLPVVVAINKFHTDTDTEVEVVRQAAMDAGALDAVLADHWAKGGAGAVDLANAVVKACEQPPLLPAPGPGPLGGEASEARGFSFLYPLELSLTEKIIKVATQIYGAADVDFSEAATEQLQRYERLGFGQLPICIAKTHLSLSADPALKGVPTGFTIPIREARASVGAGFIYVLCGSIMTVPGLPTLPGFFKVDLLPDGKIVGLF